MKKRTVFVWFFLFAGLALFAQTGPRRSSVAILPFELRPDDPASGVRNGATAAEAAALYTQLLNELASWDALNILSAAEGSEYTVKGQLELTDGRYVLSATTSITSTNRVLNTSKEEAATLAALSSRMFPFAAQVTENVPFPNYLAGTWQAVINLSDGPLTCIMEFRSDRTLRIRQFDTWEHRGQNSLRYQAFGTGTYSFWGHARRSVRDTPVDGFVTVNLRLEDALPKYASVSYARVNFNFNEDKTVLNLTGGGFGCGENFSGPSVHPERNIAYMTFTKLE